ncbi:glycine betaine ABC transporter substrate-binding protein [Clostridium minihomine]|uniref:glycine betaine ABC transporter substrate-binding protein n=1 Tax=Clostridium minihomine TaxID=2045012 RepID=UPI000C78CD4E|nr:glycine betaine ABC transporter substrate-binding protein [Clostridium minihomine]
MIRFQGKVKKALALGLSLVMITGAMGGCGQPQNEKVKTVKLGYVNWAEGIAMTNLAAAVLQDDMGYRVETAMVDVAPLFTSLVAGNTDAFMDVWLPVTHEDYMNKYGDQLEDLGVNYENAMIGLTVPAYVPINSVEELKDNKEMFNGEIVGIDSGAVVMRETERLISEYDLDYKLLSGSGPTMTAALKKAIDAKEPIVVLGWKPHWKFSRWDLKVLEDPKNIYGTSENIHTMARKGFSNDMPDVAAFLTNFKLDEQQLGSLMDAIENGSDPLEAARKWSKDNAELVKSWLPNAEIENTKKTEDKP